MKNPTLNKIVIIYIFITSGTLFSQWENYTTVNSGLPHNQFNGLALDSKNNLWLGSLAGLVKYDGNTWTVYDTSNSEIPDNVVGYIGIDKNDVIWSSATGNYAFSFDGSRWGLFDYNKYNIEDFQAFDIEFDSKNRPWYATSRFIKYYNEVNDKWIEIEHGSNDVFFSQVNCVEMDKNNVIWFGTETDGIFSYSNSSLTRYFPGNSDLPTGQISSLAVDSLNNLWIGTQKSQIVKFEILKNKWTVYNIEFEQFKDHIEQIRVDQNGEIWASSALKLLHFDGTVWDTLHVDADTNVVGRPYIITDFIINKFGNIWVIGDGSSGLYKYTRNPETSVGSETFSNYINIYPNPVKENLSFEIDNSLFINSYRVMSTDGKIIKEENNLISNPKFVNLKSLTTGTYFIELTTKDGKSLKEKFIKE